MKFYVNKDENLPIEANKKEKEIDKKGSRSNIKLISGLELTGIFLAVLLIVYVLFPNEKLYYYIQRQIKEFKSEEEDVYLSIKYLEKLLKKHPRQKDLRIALIRKFIEIGEFEKAKEHLTKYKEYFGDDDISISLELSILEHELFIEKERNTAKAEVLKERIKSLIKNSVDKVNDTYTLEEFYTKAKEFNLPKTALKIALKLSTLYRAPQSQTRLKYLKDKEIEWLKRTFYDAISVGNYKVAENTYLKLSVEDRKNYLKYTKDIANFEIGIGRLDEASKYLAEAIKLEKDKKQKIKLLEKLAEVDTWRHRYDEAVKHYIVAMNLSDDYDTKKKFFLEALQRALWSGNLDNAVAIIETYGTFFLNDKEVLKKIVDVYLQKGDINKAYLLAKKGHDLFKSDISLTKSLAKLSLWNSKVEESFRYYLEIYAKTKDSSIKPQLLNLALALNKYFVAKEILEEEFKKGKFENWKKLAEIYTHLGEVEKAISILREAYKKEKDIKILKQIVKLELSINDINGALKDLDTLLAKGDLDVLDAQELAYLLYINKQYDKSLKVLKLVKDKATNKDILYWTTLADIAWDLRDKKTSIEVAEYLLKNGLARDIDIQRLIIYYAENKKFKKVEVLAKKLLETKKSEFAYYHYLNSLYNLGKYREVVQFISSLSQSEMDKLKNKSFFWGIYANSLAKLGKIEEAIKVYELALKYNPDNKDLIYSFLWFLVDNKRDKLLTKYLVKYRDLAYSDKKFTFLYAVAYTSMQNSLEAKPFLKRLIDIEPNNVDYMLMYADVLDLEGQTEIADKYRFKLWQQLRQKLNKNPNLINDREFLKDYLRLAIKFLPAVKIEALMEKAKGVLTPKDYAGIKISWYLARGEYEKAKQLVREGLGVEPWMKLSLALKEYDKDEMKKLLQKQVKALPIRDRVDAAEKTGDIALAKKLAFEGLEKNREDFRLYKQYKELQENTAPKLKASAEVVDREIQQTKVKTSYKTKLYKNFYVELGNEQLLTNSSSGEGLINLPTNLRKSYIKLSEIDIDKRLSVEIGQRTGLKDISYLDFDFYTYLKDKFNLSFKIGYNLFTDETLYMVYGGKKDRIKAGIGYSPSPWNFFNLSIEYNKYKSLDNKAIGTGTIFELSGSHKFRLGYPDFTVSAYIRKGLFSENTDKGIINRISTVRNPQVLPVSYNEAGLRFSFGYEKKESFNKTLRPYLSMSISYNDVYGGGYGIEGGITGNAFLPAGDISIGVSYNKGFKGTGNTVSNFYIEYFLMF
ncbi:MAG: hypothetical protein DSY53_02145 [Persephonella sp.]|nr:MAG: hypothetical protein DSY53_02145 [Persephonella sp.]